MKRNSWIFFAVMSVLIFAGIIGVIVVLSVDWHTDEKNVASHDTFTAVLFHHNDIDTQIAAVDAHFEDCDHILVIRQPTAPQVALAGEWFRPSAQSMNKKLTFVDEMDKSASEESRVNNWMHLIGDQFIVLGDWVYPVRHMKLTDFWSDVTHRKRVAQHPQRHFPFVMLDKADFVDNADSSIDKWMSFNFGRVVTAGRPTLQHVNIRTDLKIDTDPDAPRCLAAGPKADHMFFMRHVQQCVSV